MMSPLLLFRSFILLQIYFSHHVPAHEEKRRNCFCKEFIPPESIFFLLFLGETICRSNSCFVDFILVGQFFH